MACEELNKLNPKTKHFELSFTDDMGTSRNYEVPLWRYLVEPKSLSGLDGSEYENKCILGFFKSNTNQDTDVIVGHEFFKEYYMMFDMSPHMQQR